MDSLKNFTTEENKYTLTGIEELEVAAAILVIFLVILVNLTWSDRQWVKRVVPTYQQAD